MTSSSDAPEGVQTNNVRPSAPRDRFFNPYRVPASEKVKCVVEDVTRQVQGLEKHDGVRKRARKANDQETFEATIQAIVCDLMHHVVAGAPGGIAITRSNQFLGTANRYRHPALNKTLPDLLDRLARPEMSFIEQSLPGDTPFDAPKRTTIRPGPRLLSRTIEAEITADDFKIAPYREVIELKREKEDFWDQGEAIDYEDTDATRLYRRQVVEINDWLREASIEVDVRFLSAHRLVDPNDRQLRRIFSRGSFESGGRLFGGFWQNLPKKDRQGVIIIDGEDVNVLDYAQMNPRILYGIAKQEPPGGDLYFVPGLEQYREGVKKVMNSMMFAEKPLSRFPKGTRNLFPKDVVFENVMAGIEARHPALVPFFHSGVGHRAMFIESQIMIDLLLDLKGRGIIALPVHDAVVIPESRTDEVKGRMLHLFQEHTGVEGLVAKEAS